MGDMIPAMASREPTARDGGKRRNPKLETTKGGILGAAIRVDGMDGWITFDSYSVSTGAQMHNRPESNPSTPTQLRRRFPPSPPPAPVPALLCLATPTVLSRQEAVRARVHSTASLPTRSCQRVRNRCAVESAVSSARTALFRVLFRVDALSETVSPRINRQVRRSLLGKCRCRSTIRTWEDICSVSFNHSTEGELRIARRLATVLETLDSTGRDVVLRRDTAM